MLETTVRAIAIAIGRGAGGGHATQLVLAGELAAKLGELGDEVLADLKHGLFGGDGTVSLDADEELRHVRVGNCSGEPRSAVDTRQ